MKKYLFLIALTVTALFTACTKTAEDDDDEVVMVSLSVTDIENNQATINASVAEGEFHGAKIVEAVLSSSVTIDYTSEVKLIKYVRENGVDIDLPYTHTLTDLKADTEMFTAVIVFNASGRATNSAYQIWTAEGHVDGWAEDSTAGDLGEIKW